MLELGREENRSSRMTGQVETALQNTYVQGDQVGGDETRLEEMKRGTKKMFCCLKLSHHLAILPLPDVQVKISECH